MRKVMVWVSALVTALAAGNASAITTDGDWSDWFTYNGNVAADDWAQGNYTLQNLNIRASADEEQAEYGATWIQLYDTEEFFYFFEDLDTGSYSGGILHIGLVTGFPGEGVVTEGIYAGDLFVGLGGSSTLDLAIGVALDPAGLPRFEQAYLGAGEADWVDPIPGPFVQSKPWRMNEGTATDVTGLLTPSVAWGTQGVHHFLEVAINLDGTQEEQVTGMAGGLRLHWTMGCGNDVIFVQDTNPLAPVPEPATIALLSMGCMGLALRARRARI